MKQLHHKNLFGWSEFNAERNLDFHSVLWVRPSGNIMIDPLPLTPHDQQHLENLGGVNLIIISNSDHIRDAANIAERTGARLYGPIAEKDSFAVDCDHWLADNDEVVPGLTIYALNGSKTPGELAVVLGEQTLVSGDLIRCHMGGELCLLPEGKLSDREAAVKSVQRLASLPNIDTVLPGDGWPLFYNGGNALKKLAQSL